MDSAKAARIAIGVFAKSGRCHVGWLIFSKLLLLPRMLPGTIGVSNVSSEVHSSSVLRKLMPLSHRGHRRLVLGD